MTNFYLQGPGISLKLRGELKMGCPFHVTVSLAVGDEGSKTPQ